MTKKKGVLIPFPKIKNSKEAIEEIQHIAGDTSLVIFLDHAEMRMLERNISRIQVFRVLREGNPTGKAEWDTKTEPGWKCTFRRITAGISLDVVVKLVQRDAGLSNLIVTVF